MDEQEEVQQNNMISNLPLLFANGYPTSLDKITETQLENFIPFMVQCSLGHINLQGKIDCSEPEWWPEDLPFTIPFSKPKKFIGNWMEKMKEIVIICYQFHKSIFLLRFCNDLASYEHASLRFINNYNSTTSLFDRRSNKLLVTFRNENMSYDQPQRSRKCLLQQKSKNGRQTGHELQQMMVEPAPFDIYLCDNCDAELYSKEAILEHEKTCNVDVDDDDVILCDTPEPHEANQQLDKSSNSENNELRRGFLLNFNLQCRNDNQKVKNAETNETSSLQLAAKEENSFMIIGRNKRMPRRNRAVHSLTRCPTIALSSPAGQLLLRTTKTVINSEYLAERLDRMERFCHAPLLSKSLNKPKYLEKKHTANHLHCTFKRPQDYSSHVYVFPRRQFSQRRRTENFLFLNSSLIRRCRPISVRLKKISEQEMKGGRPLQSTKLNIKLTRDTTRSSNWKISSPSSEFIVATIDLCSSDDDEYNDTNSQSSVLQAHTVLQATPINKVSFSKIRLKKISNRINTSEVSIIPIPKVCSVKYENVNISYSPTKIVSSSSVNESISDERSASSHYEGNILMSSPIAVSSEIGNGIPKPLRPSVNIFPNYTMNPLATIVTSSSNIISSGEGIIFRSHNQENQIQSNAAVSLITKRSNNSTATSPSDWFPGSNTVASNSCSGDSSITQSHSLERERPSKSQHLVQSFGSPSRIVSIDLTS